MTKELFDFDKSFHQELVAGVDEAGRGPLAGPVVCAGCIMPLSDMIEGINDSKAVKELTREILYDIIIERAISFSISVIDERIIDKINILNATKLGMKNAIEGLSVIPNIILVDAVTKLDIKFPYESIIKGDAKSYNIAAASILAKVTRDRIMREYDKKYPDYGFIKNKGYGTKIHITALEEFGASEIHRQTFIKNFKLGSKL